MTRSAWKCKFNNMEKIVLYKQHLPISTYSRTSCILPFLYNKNLLIHNGKKFLLTLIKPEMLFHKLGEFSQTRATFQHKRKKQKKKKKNKKMGQKTSPLIVRKQYKIAELAQYYYGKTGHFFFHTELTLKDELKQFFKRQKSKMDQLTILQNDKKIQIFINFTLNKKRYKKIRFQQKKRNKRIKKLLKRFKRFKRGCYKRRRRWKQRLNFMQPQQIFFKDFWKKQYLLQTLKITQFCKFFKGLQQNPYWFQHKSKKFLQTNVFKTTNLKKQFVNKLYKKYLKILTAKIITLSFQFYFLHKLLKYIHIFSKSSVHSCLDKNYKRFIIFWGHQVALPVHGLTQSFHKLTFSVQQKLLKTPDLSKSLIKKYFFYAKTTKKNSSKKKLLASLYTKLKTTKLQILKKHTNLQSNNLELLLKYQRLITTKLLFKLKKRIKQKVLYSHYLFRRFKYKKIYRKRKKKKYGLPIMLYNRVLFQGYKRLIRKPNLWTRFFFHDRLTFRWYFNYYNTGKPQVNINAICYNKPTRSLSNKKKQPIIKKTLEEKKQAKETFNKLPFEKKVKIKRRQMARRQKIRELREFKRARYKSYLEYQKLFYARIRANLSLKIFRRRRRYARRKITYRKRSNGFYLHTLRKRTTPNTHTFTHTRKQQLFSWKCQYNTVITTDNNLDSTLKFILKKTSYRKRVNKRIKHRFYRFYLRKTRRKKLLRRRFYKHRCRFKKRKFLLRPYLRRKTKFFKICSFMFFFNKIEYRPIVPAFLLKIHKKVHFQRFNGRRRLLRGVQKYKKRRITKFQLLKKKKNKLLKIWKKMLKKQNWFHTKKFQYYRSKKRLYKQQLLPFSRRSSYKDISEVAVQTSILNYIPFHQKKQFENVLFWNFTLTPINVQKVTSQEYSLTSWTMRRLQKRLNRTYLNKKLLYFRILACKYKKHLKKKKYFSILFFKKLLKKIIQKSHK